MQHDHSLSRAFPVWREPNVLFVYHNLYTAIYMKKQRH